MILEKNGTNVSRRCQCPLIRGINFSTLESDEPLPFIKDQSYYLAVKEEGFDHVRLPVSFNARHGEAPDFIADKEYIELIDTAIDYALKAGLYAVLDMHGFETIYDDVDTNAPAFYALWRQLSERYKGYPEQLLFEILNEPNNEKNRPEGLTAERLNEIQNEAIRIIRKDNPTRIIVAAVAEWNQAKCLKDLILPEEDDNIIVTIHNYHPLSFTCQGADWAGFPVDVKIPWTSEMENEVRAILDMAHEWSIQTGRSVWMSEFGVYLNLIEKTDLCSYLSFITHECEDRNFSWCYWEFWYGFGIFDPESKQWKDHIVNAITEKKAV